MDSIISTFSGIAENWCITGSSAIVLLLKSINDKKAKEYLELIVPSDIDFLAYDKSMCYYFPNVPDYDLVNTGRSRTYKSLSGGSSVDFTYVTDGLSYIVVSEVRILDPKSLLAYYKNDSDFVTKDPTLKIEALNYIIDCIDDVYTVQKIRKSRKTEMSASPNSGAKRVLFSDCGDVESPKKGKKLIF
uniref:Uncharacterized protein n=1 Tax=viral metagenome TaxID=1070528 RepID=A0A6C0EA55_9ZZZZ